MAGMIKILLAFLVCIFLANMSIAEPKNAGKPNIIILYADDLGYGDLASYNLKSKIPTPNLDQLAEQGLRFTDAHSSSGICSPSRYALLTGRYHWRKFHGIVQAFGPSKFSPERLTLPEMLKEKGYTTAVIGKWHLGWNWDAIRKTSAGPDGIGPDDFDWYKAIPGGPLDHGFDYYFGASVINFPPYTWIENDRVLKAPDTMVDGALWQLKEAKVSYRPGPMIAGWNPYDNLPTTTARGLEYIKEQAGGDKPFFLYFSYSSPHAPIIPNDEFDGSSKAGAYGDFVVETDDSIGQLLQALDSAGIADNTLVIFSSDNGPEHFAYARDVKTGHWSAAPLRGLKRDIYEGGHRVPMIIRWPGKISAGKASNGLSSQIDIMATLASVVGYDLPDSAAEDSHDLLPLWTGQTRVSPRHTLIHNTFENSFAIRSADWTLIADENGYRLDKFYKAWELRHGYARPVNNSIKGQLFDMKKDMAQKFNLIERYPKKALYLDGLLQQIRDKGYSAPRLE